jgi:tetratricopeptide (TPR) repeat protein
LELAETLFEPFLPGKRKMSHVSNEEIRRLGSGEAGEIETEGLTRHALSCQPCRAQVADLLEDIAPRAKREGPLKTLVELIRMERERALEGLAARAEWASFRELTRKAQRDRVIESRACHSSAFLEILLAELRSASSWKDSEFFGNLALLAIKGMDERKCPATLKNDLLAGVWIELANTRRIGSEWHHAAAALQKAEQYLAEGSGNPLPRARMFSITASLRAEQGHLSEAMSLLERCHQIYEAGKDWHWVARTLVQMAYTSIETEPERGLVLLDQAAPLIPTEDVSLRWLAANLRSGGLIEIGQIEQALLVFQEAESLLAAQTRPNAKLRNTFTAARLLEALGRTKEAEKLFEEVIAEGLEREWYKDALLDFLYLFGFHIRAGATEKAIAVCQRALAQLDLLELGHDQLRAVWTQLRDAAGRQALTGQSLAMARSYLRVHWKHPAAKMPVLASRSNGS